MLFSLVGAGLFVLRKENQCDVVLVWYIQGSEVESLDECFELDWNFYVEYSNDNQELECV